MTAWAAAASPSPVAPIPCLPTLKFAGSLYLDADLTVPDGEIGVKVGETDPNPARCGLPDRLTVYRRTGHSSAEEVVYRQPGGRAELFRSAGSTGFPMQDTVKWLVLVLVLGILAFAAFPAIMAHVRQPPIEVGGADDDVFSDPKIDGHDEAAGERVDRR
ncbi:MAG: hypothetical protein NVSMB17_17940 [Candidatus Dormibacteria bacterium]